MSKSQIKITLVRELENGNTENEQVVIKKIKFRQINRTFAILTEIMGLVQENPQLQKMMGEIFTGADPFDPTDYPDATEEELAAELEAYAQKRDKEFIEAIVASLRTLMTKLPEQILELLAAVAKIDVELLLDQEIEVGFDVLDAVLEVNDLEELYTRGKQSLGFGQKAFQFLKTPEVEDEKKPPLQ